MNDLRLEYEMKFMEAAIEDYAPPNSREDKEIWDKVYSSLPLSDKLSLFKHSIVSAVESKYMTNRDALNWVGYFIKDLGVNDLSKSRDRYIDNDLISNLGLIDAIIRLTKSGSIDEKNVENFYVYMLDNVKMNHQELEDFAYCLENRDLAELAKKGIIDQLIGMGFTSDSFKEQIIIFEEATNEEHNETIKSLMEYVLVTYPFIEVADFFTKDIYKKLPIASFNRLENMSYYHKRSHLEEEGDLSSKVNKNLDDIDYFFSHAVPSMKVDFLNQMSEKTWDLISKSPEISEQVLNFLEFNADDSLKIKELLLKSDKGSSAYKTNALLAEEIFLLNKDRLYSNKVIKNKNKSLKV